MASQVHDEQTSSSPQASLPPIESSSTASPSPNNKQLSSSKNSTPQDTTIYSNHPPQREEVQVQQTPKGKCRTYVRPNLQPNEHTHNADGSLTKFGRMMEEVHDRNWAFVTKPPKNPPQRTEIRYTPEDARKRFHHGPIQLSHYSDGSLTEFGKRLEREKAEKSEDTG